MTTAGDSILVTPGSGATIATHTVASKEHEVFMLADAAGNLIGDNLGVWASATHGPTGANEGQSTTERNRMSIFNADASLIVDVLAFYVDFRRTDDGPVGIGWRSRLARSTAHSAGTLLVPSKVDGSTGALDTDITVRSGGDITILSVTGTGENFGSSFHSVTNAVYKTPRVYLWDWRQNGGIPIVLRQNEGVYSRDISDANDNSVSFLQHGIIFRVR